MANGGARAKWEITGQRFKHAHGPKDQGWEKRNCKARDPHQLIGIKRA